MHRIARLVVVSNCALATLGTAAKAAAQGRPGHAPTYRREVPAKLARQAKITEDSAAAVARSKVPTGTIQGVELEREKGKLIYSYDIKIPGKSGIEEVNVDATDGSVIAVEHETPASEKKETTSDRNAPAGTKARKPERR